MPYDEGLAQRIREVLEEVPQLEEKRMFGGLAFLLEGRMTFGIIRDELMVRVAPGDFEAAIALPHARAMDFTGRRMRGFVQIRPAGLEEDSDLRAWLDRALEFATRGTGRTRDGRASSCMKRRSSETRSDRDSPTRAPRRERPRGGR